MWYLYIIENKLGHFYTGITKNVAKRICEHQAQGPKTAKALKGKAPLTLKYSQLVGDHSTALKMEIAVKKLSKIQKLAIISGERKLNELLSSDKA
ncbi:GIY-YIG nuclease family protein [Aestuariibacter sp. AA17]|uniref:GIY-YIG nuclease family protein n=1 Tax=Fluctibacter corallii TaxID=2984329 RepID=A0ABT3ACP3_9ALTE|nr:GIY-YIG nuclease family protein [Aestuariibacter sp. AA17]MCV2886057.1 GIY-YIG nuclease family protein [Aestuariibacter sp. AA17]